MEAGGVLWVQVCFPVSDCGRSHLTRSSAVEAELVVQLLGSLLSHNAVLVLRSEPAKHTIDHVRSGNEPSSLSVALL